jgi:hypothetical protein
MPLPCLFFVDVQTSLGIAKFGDCRGSSGSSDGGPWFPLFVCIPASLKACLGRLPFRLGSGGRLRSRWFRSAGRTRGTDEFSELGGGGGSLSFFRNQIPARYTLRIDSPGWTFLPLDSPLDSRGNAFRLLVFCVVCLPVWRVSTERQQLRTKVLASGHALVLFGR